MDADASSSDESVLDGSQAEDSRGRKKWNVEIGGCSHIFGVGATSVKRYVNRAQQGGSLEPGKAPGKQSKFGLGGIKLLEEDLHARPAATYENRAELLHELLGVKVSRATSCRTIHRMGGAPGYTRKKISGCQARPERDEFGRAACRVMVAEATEPTKLVFVHESVRWHQHFAFSYLRLLFER
jgi:transposase